MISPSFTEPPTPHFCFNSLQSACISSSELTKPFTSVTFINIPKCSSLFKQGYLPMQKWEKILPRTSFVVISPSFTEPPTPHFCFNSLQSEFISSSEPTKPFTSVIFINIPKCSSLFKQGYLPMQKVYVLGIQRYTLIGTKCEPKFHFVL